MNAQQAIEALHRASYRAQAGTVFPNTVIVMYPVHRIDVMTGTLKLDYFERRTIRVEQVTNFISERS